MSIQDKLGNIKTLYTGTSTELREKLSKEPLVGKFDLVLAIEASMAVKLIQQGISEKSPAYFVLAAPLALDVLSRFVYAAATRLQRGRPCYNPNLIGTGREYLQKRQDKNKPDYQKS